MCCIHLQRLDNLLRHTALIGEDVHSNPYFTANPSRRFAGSNSLNFRNAILFAKGSIIYCNRVHITAASGNYKSTAIPPRLGFIHESTQRNSGRMSTGELVDMFVFAMTPKEYEVAKSGGLMAKTHT
jgi:hypothetical protein